MEFYQKAYHLLFNGITDALEAMDRQNFGQAGELLRRAQQEAEELYLSAGDAAEETPPGPEE